MSYIRPISHHVVDFKHMSRDELERHIKKIVEFIECEHCSVRKDCDEMKEFLLAEGYRFCYYSWKWHKVFNRGYNLRSSTKN